MPESVRYLISALPADPWRDQTPFTCSIGSAWSRGISQKRITYNLPPRVNGAS